MSNFSILCSFAAMFAAIAVGGVRPVSWLKNLLNRRKAEPMNSSAVLSREAGWQLISCDDEQSFNEWLGKDEEGLPYGSGEEHSLGSHLLVELFGCDKASLEEERSVGVAMRDAAVASEATVVAQSFHEFQPYGVSGAIVIQESHYTIHTWPEHGYAAVDLFYCGGTVKVHKAVRVLRERFKPERIKFLVVRRGLQGEVDR
ncbi:MAG: adenosylmethionine decarboxylase [Fimbriimonadaceae bacterium]|nr:adenosylmethionine decarboxylase [Fimbriimonadaceae bacterium]